MATCSPRVEIGLVGVRQARFRRRHMEKPPKAMPARAIQEVAGSGTAAIVIVAAPPAVTTSSVPDRPPLLTCKEPTGTKLIPANEPSVCRFV